VTPPPELRPLAPSDAAELYALVDSNRTRLSRWMPWAAGQTLDGTAQFILQTIDQERARDGFQRAVIVDGAIAGVAGFHRLDRENLSTSIGYWLGAEYEGRGLMTDAVRALLDHAFDVWGMHRVELRVAPDNARSLALAARLGFREEGLLREAERFGDEHRDLLMHSLLVTERQRSRPGTAGSRPGSRS
jgi:ribosomal-protein-serine acetyltransferase